MKRNINTISVKKALLPTGWAENVEIEIDSLGYIKSVSQDARFTSGSMIQGVLLPGMPNLHSHAHQRAMVGLAEAAGLSKDSFWTWREAMYSYVSKVSPDQFQAIASQLYIEMLKNGYTNVAEFQYLHHDTNGQPYQNVAEISLRCVNAAEEVGLGITVLPVLYGYSGFGGQKPLEEQRRFINEPEQFMKIVNILQSYVEKNPNANVGIAPHSLRAVTKETLSLVLDNFKSGPVHIHIAEQIPEVEASLAWSGKRPVEWLFDNFDIDSRWCLIHATHLNDKELSQLATSKAVVGICPTTEANLGDGIFPAEEFVAKGGSFGIGSDSQVSVNPTEELRWLEYAQRLIKNERNVLAPKPNVSTGESLYLSALSGGAQACARNIGAIEAGKRADFVILDDSNPRLFGRDEKSLIDSWIFGCSDNPVKDVFVGGKHLVKNFVHINEADVKNNFIKAVTELFN
ncbi:formimidoylglutamate deiminase [Alteromonas mediterranea]|uniref:formimidoylglutamate deiminase n=1 Tax=Alteromonas mediterranea TaxID=314275 RepID=UPI000355565E|nr:formimidoylglutamate deiminase [Alteromonas mediterranea]AGP88899.1 N-formimino-L-glutamate deiminase [Alteromonas mediterranea U7]AGP92990.1 N-formimino-L-glutamate deiminase [Alteromonas mediterranea U8]|tara:strand:+ start:6745 stop:8118 length:1374 start_codon:yes stop_codon:yes gene_type:complete